MISGALVVAALAGLQVPGAAQASDCRWIFCGTVKNASTSQFSILVGANWSTSAGRPTGVTSTLRPGQSSRDSMKDADGYLLARGVCAWFYGAGGTTQARNYLKGDGGWHKIGDDFAFTLNTYKC
ncbi:AICAR transformylase/IMP cyclohydrolase PurH [Microbacterium testaceum StLB037]|uniref:AICAR transformylase/IMP cyclohydrolase PurH n=1 Tax=Microbacterium testaceum (strain StLB037) TaxID=979556 RepID=E8N707_MICTS|nr:hypothetical protein [Microbacterium testaceum]BAJ74224.1 AICAR transformylase/IMP cyclohydrolase PurH [Microbacterium testaceum StLB037]